MKTLVALKKSADIFLQTRRYLELAKEPGASLQNLKEEWANELFSKIKFDLKVFGSEPSLEKSVLFLGNHISYLDCPLLVRVVPEVAFVAKAELQHWPIFGNAARAVGTVFVKREKKSSRKEVRETVKNALREGRRIAIFPAGTTCTRESKPWRHGAFEIAYDTGAWVQPFRLNYRPLRPVAYIDDDFFPTHILQVLAQDKIEAEIEFHDPIKITDPIRDSQYWQEWSKGLLPK